MHLLRPLLLFCTLILLISCTNNDYDLLIKNGQIIDGTGSEAFSGHVLVKDGKIARIGDFDISGISAGHTIDAEGRVISPGFVDVHSRGVPVETPRFDNFCPRALPPLPLG